ncbi:hypothetical protein AWM79_15205 [Pseudomonas agarici]|uniref:Uncharacterized protein n=2 Tax=Pseudomonas agarici TaxID=46677 RepID=A0A0X1T3B1_PSEAA|nr:hypothetical protein AWM79_15205 [Pseudomonas agarici]
MLMPDKHIKFAESLIGLGSFILEELDEPKSIDTLWDAFRQARLAKEYPSPHSFESLVLAVDVLFAIGAIEPAKLGVLKKCA